MAVLQTKVCTNTKECSCTGIKLHDRAIRPCHPTHFYVTRTMRPRKGGSNILHTNKTPLIRVCLCFCSSQQPIGLQSHLVIYAVANAVSSAGQNNRRGTSTVPIFFCLHWSCDPSFNCSSFFDMHAPRQPHAVTEQVFASFFRFFGDAAFPEYFFVPLPFSLCIHMESTLRRTCFPSGWDIDYCSVFLLRDHGIYCAIWWFLPLAYVRIQSIIQSNQRFCLCSLWSHLNVFTFPPPDRGMLISSRCVQIFLSRQKRRK